MNKNRGRTSALPVLGVTLVRVILGVWWISQFTWKPPPTFGCPDGGFCLWLNKEIQYPLIPFYGQILHAVVLPNAYLFGWLAFIVETAVGLSLALGLLTRLGGGVATLWSLNLLIGLVAVPGETSWYYIATILLNFLFFAMGSSDQISLDRALGISSWWTGLARESRR